MAIKKYLTLRVWVLIIFLALAILAIKPNPWASGVFIKAIQDKSEAQEAGMKTGEIITAINNRAIQTIQDYNREVEKIQVKPAQLKVVTDQGTFNYSSFSLGFSVDDNASIVTIDTAPINGTKVLFINNIPVNSSETLKEATKNLFIKRTITIKTNQNAYAFLSSGNLGITIGAVPKNNIKKGLDLQGGTRVLLKPIGEKPLTDANIADIIDVLNNRLNVYGLADLKIRAANDLAGNKFIVVEIAGASREEVKGLIAQQGKFEAKIGNETVFVGGKGDVPFVCRNDGSCSGVQPPCQKVSAQNYLCTFQFAITISEEAAKRHASITKELDVNFTEGGSYLSKTIDFYLDDKSVDSLRISTSLKGQVTTQISISGPGYGATQEDAFNNAIEAMNKLQTILITGSLPHKLEIVKLDSISPFIGQTFVKNAIFVGILATLAVGVVIYIRYRRLKIIIPIFITILSETILTLGLAALIQWNIDLAGIAGIIAALGTGVDDQIVITDEILKKERSIEFTWKQKVKRAFFIVVAAYATTVAAMIPLWNVGAGLVRGFAVTTIIGVTMGVLITRPAFASLIKSLLEE